MEDAQGRWDGLSLDRRDPAYIAKWLPVGELVFRYYFRVRLSGLDALPRTAPLLFIGNHSGGLSTPDTAMATHAFFTARGVEEPIHALVHPGIFAIPNLARHIMRVGGLAATPRMAAKVLEAGRSLLLYPGAGDEAYRPHSRRNRVELNGRSGYVKLALRYGAPVVPVVSHGSHDTLLVLDDGKALAERLGLTKLGVERLPLTYSWPHGLALGATHSVPFPARIDIAFGTPIEFSGFTPADARDPEAVAFCHTHVERTMQAMLDGLIAARRAAGVARRGSGGETVRGR